MAAVAPIQAPTHAPTKRIIVSRTLAAQIVETTAVKHAIDAKTLLCARWDRFAIAARAETAYRLQQDLGWSLRTIGGYLGCTHPNVRKLLSFHNRYSPRLTALTLGANPTAVAEAMDGRLRELEGEVRRLSGVYLAERMALKLGLRLRCGILLAILAEAYPRYVRGAALSSLYDAACEQLGYGEAGDRGAASFDLLTKNACDLSARFSEMGWPAPNAIGPFSGSRVLTHGAAEFLYERIGAPGWGAVESGRVQLLESTEEQGRARGRGKKQVKAGGHDVEHVEHTRAEVAVRSAVRSAARRRGRSLPVRMVAA